jgi:hypothetical protein
MAQTYTIPAHVGKTGLLSDTATITVSPREAADVLRARLEAYPRYRGRAVDQRTLARIEAELEDEQPTPPTTPVPPAAPTTPPQPAPPAPAAAPAATTIAATPACPPVAPARVGHDRIARRALHRLAARAHQRKDWDAKERTDAAWSATCDEEFRYDAHDENDEQASVQLEREIYAAEEANVAAEDGRHRHAANWHRAAAKAAQAAR